MRKFSSGWLLLLAGLTLIGLAVPSMPAAPLNPDPKPRPLSSAEKLRKDLDQAISIKFAEQPLNLALDQLHEETKINFVLDRNVIMAMGINLDETKIQGDFKDVKVRTVLRHILGANNLGYAIVADSIFVSSDEMAMYKQMQQRISLDLDKVEFAQALKRLSRETATNLIVDARVLKEANQVVSLQLEDVPLETAVRLMAEMVGLKPVRIGNVLFVSSKANAQELRADPDLVPKPNPMPGMAAEIALPPALPVPPPVLNPNPNPNPKPMVAPLPPANPETPKPGPPREKEF